MMVTESLICHSIEDFLSPSEIELILPIVEQLSLRCDSNASSIHSIPGISTAHTKLIYEPNGRIESSNLPQSVLNILNGAFYRSLVHLKRILPSVDKVDSWVFVEYGEGQYITPHIDLAENERNPSCEVVAGISIQLSQTEAAVGGNFYIETCGSQELWEGPSRVKSDSDNHSEWYKRLKRTRWISEPMQGTAYIYGSQLTHGTIPVISGKISKIIGFITAK